MTHALRMIFPNMPQRISVDTLIVRGRSDKYAAYKRKTKILEKWRFISQHNILLARYT